MLYLLHFDRPYHHARHYRGMCGDKGLAARLERHRKGLGARLLQVILAVGIRFRLVRTWSGGKKEERLLKKRAIREICPVCNPQLVRHLCKEAILAKEN
jgi:hypothetical protein